MCTIAMEHVGMEYRERAPLRVLLMLGERQVPKWTNACNFSKPHPLHGWVSDLSVLGEGGIDLQAPLG